MFKTCLGLDIGASAVKAAVVKNGSIRKLCSFVLPEDLPREGGRVLLSDELSRELGRFLHRERIMVRRCALVLPPDLALVRRITVPWMSVRNLKVNLPYEFHDYIQKDKNQYFYDYAVVGTRTEESGDSRLLDLVAAVSAKETISGYKSMLRRAGLKMAVAVPEYLTYRNLIADYERVRQDEHPKEYCIVDMGYRSIRVHMYRGCIYETTRVIEYGGTSAGFLEAAALEDRKKEDPQLREMYGTVAVEILRAVNFYGFNTPDSDLQDIYFGGVMAKSEELMEMIRGTLKLNIHSITELLPLEGGESAELYSGAIGVAMEMNGR
ncbi:pilus assembly protein PilM [Lachnospiraceae bacterium 54-53]